MVLILLYFFFKPDDYNKLYKKKILVLLLYLFLCSTIFFLKFPTFRYGYSYLISFFIVIFIFFKNRIDYHKNIKLLKIILFIIPVIFVGKQIDRIYKKNDLVYLNKPWPNIYSLEANIIHKKKEIFSDNKLKIFYSEKECSFSNSICTNYKIRENIKLIKKNRYYILTVL